MTATDRLFVMAWLVALGAQLGCAVVLIGSGAIAGAGLVAYAKGELSAIEEVSFPRAWAAAQAAMDDLDLTIVSRQRGEVSAKLVARGGDNRRVTVSLERQVGDLTEIRVRVGIFGEESLSRLVLEKIRQRLRLRPEALRILRSGLFRT
jgi:hypothetical protein